MKKIIMLLLLIIFIVVTVLFLKNLFFPDSQEALYGTRLDGIEEYPVDNLNDVKAAFDELESVSSSNIRIQGKTINISIVLSETYKDIKTVTKTNINLFSKETLEFYDIQVFINIEEETEGYPIIGYKNNDSESLFWTN